jgi:uncharacterized protein (DUF2141 family)
MKCIIITFLLFLPNIILSQKQTISVNITGFETNNGKAMIMLLDKNEKEVEKHVLDIKNEAIPFNFRQIEAGNYAVKVFHDKNSNQKLDKNLFGMPTEKWGVSNNLKAKLGPPNFKNMLFEVKDDIEININLQ